MFYLYLNWIVFCIAVGAILVLGFLLLRHVVKEMERRLQDSFERAEAFADRQRRLAEQRVNPRVRLSGQDNVLDFQLYRQARTNKYHRGA